MNSFRGESGVGMPLLKCNYSNSRQLHWGEKLIGMGGGLLHPHTCCTTCLWVMLSVELLYQSRLQNWECVGFQSSKQTSLHWNITPTVEVKRHFWLNCLDWRVCTCWKSVFHHSITHPNTEHSNTLEPSINHRHKSLYKTWYLRFLPVNAKQLTQKGMLWYLINRKCFHFTAFKFRLLQTCTQSHVPKPADSHSQHTSEDTKKSGIRYYIYWNASANICGCAMDADYHHQKKTS